MRPPLSAVTRRRRAAALAGALAAATAVARPAAAQVNQFVPGTPRDASQLGASSITGADMAGMLVSWTFGSNVFDTAVWGDIGLGNCGVRAGPVVVSTTCAGATHDTDWTLINNDPDFGLVELRFNGAPGGVAFDCGWAGVACVGNGGAPGVGTPGSADGFSLTRVGGTAGTNGFGRYRHVVGVGGSAPVGDLFEELSLSFEVLQSGTTYRFRVDTDAATIDPVPSVVPEPSGWALLAAGLAGLAGTARRRVTRRRHA